MFITKDMGDIEVQYGGKDHDNQGLKTTFTLRNKNIGPKDRHDTKMVQESKETGVIDRDFKI